MSNGPLSLFWEIHRKPPKPRGRSTSVRHQLLVSDVGLFAHLTTWLFVGRVDEETLYSSDTRIFGALRMGAGKHHRFEPAISEGCL